MEHSIVYLRSAHTGSDTHSNRSSTWPNFPCLFNMSTVNAPEIFPILALRDFVQCPWHFPSTPDALQLWMVIFTLYFHPRLEPWALASHSLLFCPNWSQLSGRGSDHPAWVWQGPHLVPSLLSPPHVHPICWSRVDLRGLGCLCKRQDAQAWTEAGSRRQIWVLITSCTAWLFLAAATQKGPSKNRAFSRQTCSHKHISPGNINRRQKNVLGLCFPFLVPCASTSLSIAPSQVTISLCNAMQEHHRH